MKYSIIIPVFKTELYLRQCVESVLRQTYSDFELILVDDGSPDACPMICEELRELDDRIRVIHQENSGIGIARNAGIKVAQGEYLLFLDSDDFWLKDTVLEIINNSVSSCDLAVFDLQRLTNEVLDPPDLNCFRSFQDRYMSGEDFLSAALEQYPFYLWFFWRYVFKADLFADRRFLFSDHRSREDVALCYRVILNAGEVLIIKDSFYAYRQNRQESVTQTVTYDTVHAMLSVAAQEISRVRDMNGIPENVRKLLCSNLSKEYFDALTLSSRLSEPERSRILCELEQCKWVAKYRARKDRIKAALIHFFGVSMLSGLMGFKWKLQRSKKQI